MINFVVILSKFTAELLACGSWFDNHFANVMTQFIINKRTDALKTDMNLLKGYEAHSTDISYDIPKKRAWSNFFI